MTDWKTYKGQNPWSCIAPVDFISYNEGSYIAKSPEVSGGTPTWEIGKTGAVITSKHIPCGYWFKDYDSDAQLRRICSGSVDTILYTTLQMSVSGQQTLQASDGKSDDCYTWAVSSGGGSLSSSSGKSVVYTAPSSNANCASNPTITLTCGGTQVDSISIAVNQVTSSYAAYEFNDGCEQGCRRLQWSYELCEYYYQYLKTKYTCNGSIYSGPAVVTIQAASSGCSDTNYPACTQLKEFCDGRSHCIAAGGCCNTYTHGFVDLRTSSQKAAGCCPADLL